VKIKPKIATLCFLIQDEKILVGTKKYGPANGIINGFGGKSHPDETPHDCVVREFAQETSAYLLDPQLKGLLMPSPQTHIYIFIATKYTGTIQESEEMTNQWINIKDLPYDKMWPNDKKWFSYMFGPQMFIYKDNSVKFVNKIL